MAYDLHPESRAALVRLQDEWELELAHDRVEHALRPELPERRVRQRHPFRGGQAGPGQLRLRVRLVPRAAADPRRRPDERHVVQLQHRLDGAVLALSPVQRHRDGVRALLLQAIQQRAVDVPLAHLDADRAQRARQTSPGTQRHLTLVGQASGQDGDGSIGHRAILADTRRAVSAGVRRDQFVSGEGLCGPRPISERADVPNVRTTSSSASRTAARRRTPSVMRSGVG